MSKSRVRTALLMLLQVGLMTTAASNVKAGSADPEIGFLLLEGRFRLYNASIDTSISGQPYGSESDSISYQNRRSGLGLHFVSDNLNIGRSTSRIFVGSEFYLLGEINIPCATRPMNPSFGCENTTYLPELELDNGGSALVVGVTTKFFGGPVVSMGAKLPQWDAAKQQAFAFELSLNWDL